MNVSRPYKYSSGYICLPIKPDLTDVDETISLFHETLYLKSEFHISLLCVKNILAQFSEIHEKQILRCFNDFIAEYSLSDFVYSNEYRIVTAFDGRKSIIQMVKVKNLEKFFEKLRKQLAIEIDTQPTHITIYTLQKNKGIGVNNKKDLEKTWVFQNKVWS